MADRRIYHRRHLLRTLVTVLVILLLTAVIITTAIFLSFRKYIVYTSDGVRLDIPWLRDEEENEQEKTDAANMAASVFQR